MKKIEFDYSQGRFLIETDEPNNDAFIKEYSDIFFDKLSNYRCAKQNAPIVSTIKEPNIEDSITSSPKAINETSSDLISLFDITEKQLAYLIDFSNDGIKIIVRNKFIKGTKAEMQVKLSLLYCGACEYKGIKANTKDVRNICSTYQCLDGNFAPNIKRENYFNISNGVNADICLTMPGKDKLVEVVKEILASMDN